MGATGFVIGRIGELGRFSGFDGRTVTLAEGWLFCAAAGSESPIASTVPRVTAIRSFTKASGISAVLDVAVMILAHERTNMAATPSTMLELGTVMPDFRLPDFLGKPVSSEDFRTAKATLVVFLCPHCPFVRHTRM